MLVTIPRIILEYEAKDIPQDKIFYFALLGSEALVTVTVAGVDLGAFGFIPPAAMQRSTTVVYHLRATPGTL
ncbi:hypothetical protein ABHI18_012224 [Aspergillus niger]